MAFARSLSLPLFVCRAGFSLYLYERDRVYALERIVLRRFYRATLARRPPAVIS